MPDPTPLSGRYGELRAEARQALWYVRYPGDLNEPVGSTDDLLNSVHPIYVAVLEAKDREIKDFILQREYLWPFKDRAIEAEQREAEARRLLAAIVLERDRVPYKWMWDDSFCEYCGGSLAGEHKESCAWLAAKNFLESKP